MPRICQLPIAVVLAALWAGGAAAQGFREPHPHDFAKDVDAFHSILAPVWHMPLGKERSRRACAQADNLQAAAGAIRSADATQLSGAVSAFKAQCQGNPAQVDAAFAQVHDAFHHLMEAAR